jgi:hypothetical protein
MNEDTRSMDTNGLVVHGMLLYLRSLMFVVLCFPLYLQVTRKIS